MGTKKIFYIRKESNSRRICLEHQYGRRFIVLEHQYGRRDVMWKRSKGLGLFPNLSRWWEVEHDVIQMSLIKETVFGKVSDLAVLNLVWFYVISIYLSL